MDSSIPMKTWKIRFDVELSQQKEEVKEKEELSPLKCIKTSDLQHSFSAMETLTGELWLWLWMETKCESKRSVMVSICLYSEIQKERIRNLDSEHFILSLFKKKVPNQGLQKKSPTSAISHSQKVSMQGHYCGNYKNFRSRLQTFNSKCKKFIFLFH
jgi:hypothetical protein